jgi:hypothetical protein
MRNSRFRGRVENPCGSNGSRNECSQRVVYSVGQPTVNTLDNVAIGVERDGYACVSEELLDELGVPAMRSIVAQVWRKSWSLKAGSPPSSTAA